MSSAARKEARQLGQDVGRIVAGIVAKFNDGLKAADVSNQTELGPSYQQIVTEVNARFSTNFNPKIFNPESAVVDITGKLQDMRQPA